MGAVRQVSRREPERVDGWGVQHRPGCESGTWEVTPSAAGVSVARCAGCGAVRLILAGGGARE